MEREVEEVEMEVDEVEEVEVNIFVCVLVKISQNCTFSLFFGHNQPEKCNTCVLLLFSARQVLAAQAKKWKEARHSTTCLTLNPQWAKIIQVKYPCIMPDKILSAYAGYYVTHTEATFLKIGM